MEFGWIPGTSTGCTQLCCEPNITESVSAMTTLRELSPTEDSTTWQVGQRVSRKKSDELGTVVEADGEVKIKWDGGRTSYFRRGVPANVRAA
jgi:hypothetical protein